MESGWGSVVNYTVKIRKQNGTDLFSFFKKVHFPESRREKSDENLKIAIPDEGLLGANNYVKSEGARWK